MKIPATENPSYLRAKILLGNEVRINDPHSEFDGQTGIAKQLLKHCLLDVLLPNGRGVYCRPSELELNTK